MAQNLLKASQRLATANIYRVQAAAFHNRAKIGNRDVVGYGHSGEPSYVDDPVFPLPSIRFRENTADVLALREKEKGDWRKLTLDEKKALYRASFCQTYAEMKAPTGVWKPMISAIFLALSLSIWSYVWLIKYVYPELPITLSQERREAQLRRMIDMRVNPIDGLTSKWDYEKGQWKE